MFFCETMGRQQSVGGRRTAGRGRFLDLGLRFQVDRHKRFVLRRMARAAESKFQIGIGCPVGILEMLGQLAVAFRAGERSVFVSHFEELDLFMAGKAGGIPFGRIRRFCRPGNAGLKKEADEEGGEKKERHFLEHGEPLSVSVFPREPGGYFRHCDQALMPDLPGE